jgi:primosomal protein N' (replication factor Y)
MTVDVLVEIKAKRIDRTFTYSVPNSMVNSLKIGIRVLVPFGRQKLEGFVLNVNTDTISYDYELKNIIDVIDEEPVINEEMLDLGKYISKKTLSTLISAYQAMLPSALKAKKGFVVNKKFACYLKLNEVNNIDKLVSSEKQKIIIDLLKEKEIVLKKECDDISKSAVKTLIDKKIIIKFEEEIYRLNNDQLIRNKNITLSNDQKEVIDIVKDDLGRFNPFLLHGVTGSGKTEVYMHIIEEVLKLEKEAIVLVPEISLTPQMVNNFKNRFGSKIAILHSRLNNGEKYDEWRKIERKEVSIVIGARSAVFAPFTNLGIIIIDEEHSATYKQESNPRYNAIDIALYRAKKHSCPLVLGSATPSIESYTRAKTGVYTLLELNNRINNKLPKVILVDMKDEIKRGSKVISRFLKEQIEDRLAKKQQVILLLNRRGYTTVITCHSCGYTDKCPNCDIPLTYHKASNTMRCHYCGYGNRKLIKCPSCKSEQINQFGMGTQKLEEEIIKLFPNSKVLRMDVDTTSKKGSHEKIISEFETGKYDILIGTQMIAKGLDFANVTLVGVLNGDASLNIPDFRSAERTFQLLNQVAGRAGRGEEAGLVIIQSFNQDHYSIVKASIHDYKGFYNEELKIRKSLNYPPYYNLSVIKIECSNFDLAMKESNKIKDYLVSNLNKNVMVLGPSSASVSKINNIYNIQIVLKYKKKEDVINSLCAIDMQYKHNNKVKIEIDLSPIKI